MAAFFSCTPPVNTLQIGSLPPDPFHAEWGMMDNALHTRIKNLLVNNLMLQVTAEEIQHDQPLFGPEGLGLDSVDALQLVVALDKHFGLKISDPDVAREVLKNVGTIAEAVLKVQPGSS